MHSLLHAYASRPDGPVVPVVLRAMEWIKTASTLSKMTGWVRGGVPDGISTRDVL